MAVTAHHDQVGITVRGVGQDDVGHVHIARVNPPEFDVQVVTRKVLRNIGALDFARPVLAGSDGHHIDRLAAGEKRHGVVGIARTTANAAPSTIAGFIGSLPLEAQNVSNNITSFVGLKDEIWHVVVAGLEKHLQRKRGR